MWVVCYPVDILNHMTKVYICIEDRGEYRNITTVDSDGNYHQRNVCGENDEHIFGEFRTTLWEMQAI